MIRIGDCLALAKELPDNSVDCIVTSPPYYGLRDYGVPAAWGLEKSLGDYLERLQALGGELLRVLRPQGTFWLNLGDSYSERGNSGGNNGITNLQASSIREKGYRKNPGFKRKELLGVPWRVAFSLQDQGWYLRSDIVWHKPAPMPEPVTDRPTRSHEFIFLLTKSPRYWYDAKAIAEPCVSTHPSGNGYGRSERVSLNGRGQENPWTEIGGTRNARSVWTINTESFPEAHFAVFPPELPRRCILAGCPEGGTVIDPFTGSGTTGMVAKQLGREFIGFEINPEYAAMAERRIADVTPSMFAEAM